MDIQPKLIGHEKMYTLIKKNKEHGTLNHAYCFIGPHHVGKSTLVMHLAAELLEVNVHKVRKHPDFIHIKQEKNKKTDKTKKYIDVEQIRNAKHQIKTKPFVAKYRVVFIESAEKMNQSAANALLKTIEEPSAQTILFLTTPDDARLPKTILSRCQRYQLSLVPTALITTYLTEQGDALQEAQEKARLAHGLPGKAIRWANDDELYNAYTQQVHDFHNLIGKPFYKKIKETEYLFGDKTDHIRDREKIITTLQIWQVILRDYAEGIHHNDQAKIHHLDIDPAWTDEAIIAVYDKIQEAKINIRKNIHPRLLIETILLTIP